MPRVVNRQSQSFACLWTDSRPIKSDIFPRRSACRLASSPIFLIINVNLGKKHLTSSVKMGYYMTMFTDFISFILRISLIVALWVFVWKILEPRTQLMRILRAVVLLLGLLGVLVVLRMTGRWLSSFNPTSFYFGVLYSVLAPHKIEPCRNLVRGHLYAKKTCPE